MPDGNVPTSKDLLTTLYKTTGNKFELILFSISDSWHALEISRF